MNSRSFFPVIFLLTAFSFLSAQEAFKENGADPDPAGLTVPSGPALFPLNLLLDAARGGSIPWQPDWPAAMPPDAFTLNAGQARSLTLTLPADLLDPAGNAGAEASGNTATAAAGDETEGEAAAVEYRITRDAGGRFLEFPFFQGGTFYQAAVIYDDTAPERISKITLGNPAAPDPVESGDSPWEFEFLEYNQEAPSLVRIKAGGDEPQTSGLTVRWYFAALEYLNRQTNETWYDPEGLVQAFFSLEYREASNLWFDSKKRLVSIESRFDQADNEDTGGKAILVYEYDSAGCISSLGVSSALYTAAARPRYWERPDGNYTLQWDEQGFLVRQSAVKETAVKETGAVLKPEEQDLDIRYEYTLDEHSNWTERREISLTRRFGRLVPEGERVIRRNITYGDTDND